MCDQSPGAPASLSAPTSAVRICLIRSAMEVSSDCHSAERAGSERTAVAMAAPWIGGDEYMTLVVGFG
jgi:hypothetical protein